VSLLGLGAQPSPDEIEAARAAAGRIRMPPFRVAFNRLGTWGRGGGVRPIVLWGDEGVIGVEWLHAALRAALRRGPPAAFCPHMTLARERAELAERFVEPIDWWAQAFVLVRSGGGRTEVLGRWPLRA
jgi:2'-5' RNA ligase